MNVGIFTYTVEMCINCVFTAWYSRQACIAGGAGTNLEQRHYTGVKKKWI